MLPVYFSEKNINYLLTAVFESIKFISTATSVETILPQSEFHRNSHLKCNFFSHIAILIKEDLNFYSLETLRFKTVDLNSFISSKSIFPSHNLHFFSNGVTLIQNNTTLPPQEANYYPFSIDIIVLNQTFNIDKFIPNPTEYQSNKSCP